MVKLCQLCSLRFLVKMEVLLSVIAVTVMSEQTYSTKYDNVDLESVIYNDRLLHSYVNCLLDLGPCTADGAELKGNLPDAIDNGCEKCSEKQRTGSEQVMHHIIDNRPDWWDLLEKRYNPDGTYKKMYLEKREEERKMEAITPI